MATYSELEAYSRKQSGCAIKTCWIADVKRRHGLITRSAPNRIDPSKPKYPCPADKRPVIEQALRHFGMI